MWAMSPLQQGSPQADRSGKVNMETGSDVLSPVYINSTLRGGWGWPPLTRVGWTLLQPPVNAWSAWLLIDLLINLLIYLYHPQTHCPFLHKFSDILCLWILVSLKFTADKLCPYICKVRGKSSVEAQQPSVKSHHLSSVKAAWCRHNGHRIDAVLSVTAQVEGVLMSSVQSGVVEGVPQPL